MHLGDLRIDAAYIPDTNQRLAIYRQVAQARTDADIDRVLADVRDRYGPLPESVLSLADHARIRVMADHLKIDSIEKEGKTIVFKFRDAANVYVVPIDDDQAEQTEGVRVRLADKSHYTVVEVNRDAVVHIFDDDAPAAGARRATFYDPDQLIVDLDVDFDLLR